jgi:putative ABC transport system permease protein
MNASDSGRSATSRRGGRILGGAVLAAARAAMARRRLQTVIVGLVVGISAATAVLAIGLIVVSHGPFDASFAAARGAHVTANFSADVAREQLAGTAHASGVDAAAGPFDEVTASVNGSGDVRLGDGVIVGRAEQGGGVDQLTLDTGSWLTGPGQIVLSRHYAGPMAAVGSDVTIGGAVALRVVGIATSITGTADAWVWPSQTDVLQREGSSRQMLYRFTSHDSDASLRDALAAATRTLPGGAITSTTNYLTVRQAVNRSISAFVPFIVAFAVLGIFLSVLITTNVVNGAVVAGFRTIGVLKTLGYTPRQVVAVYVVQVLGPAIVGCVVGVPLGVALAVPLLGQTDRAYDLPSREVGVPPWVIVAVLLAAPLLVAVSAVGPAARAGRLAAYQAINVGRAPRTGRGFRARRALTASPLSPQVALGLGMPLARPSRAAGTVVALLLGSVTLVFAVGLATSLDRIHTAFTRLDAVQVTIDLAVPGNGGPGVPTAKGPAVTTFPDPTAVRGTVAATAGTLHTALVRYATVRASGIAQDIYFQGYAGDASWAGFPMISGRWYANSGEVVASSYFLRQTGHRVGDRLTLSGGGVVTITGQFLDGSDNLSLVGDSSLAKDSGREIVEVGLVPGTDAGAYAQALQDRFPIGSGVFVDNRTRNANEETFLILDALITTLTLLLCGVAALGVLNTVVLNMRERVQEIGVLKALGMTPRQTRTMVITSMVGLGLLAGAIAVPIGVALQHRILPIMGDAAGTALPNSIVDVYGTGQLILLGATGILLAVLGALLPAGWAARTRVATALRAE